MPYESTPNLDVVICTYNRADQLAHTLEALAEQDASNDGRWQVLVVDNNCTDGTPALVDQYIDRLPGLRRVGEQRQGLTEARQRGFLATEAPWVAFVDDDCVPEVDWVSNVLAAINTKPQMAAFNGSNTLRFDDDQVRPWVHPQMFAAEAGDAQQPTRRQSLHGAGLVLRRHAVERSGWLEAPKADDRRGNSLISGGDNELAARTGAAGDGGGLWFLPDCRMHHTVDHLRLTMPYLMRLNYRLAEAGALLRAMGSETSGQWRKAMIRQCGWRALSLIGRRTDPMRTPGSGYRGYLLAVSRTVGAVAGFIKLAARPNDLRRDALGIATPHWVEQRTKSLLHPGAR